MYLAHFRIGFHTRYIKHQIQENNETTWCQINWSDNCVDYCDITSRISLIELQSKTQDANTALYMVKSAKKELWWHCDYKITRLQDTHAPALAAHEAAMSECLWRMFIRVAAADARERWRPSGWSESWTGHTLWLGDSDKCRAMAQHQNINNKCFSLFSFFLLLACSAKSAQVKCCK